MKSKRRKIFYVALSILIAATIWFYVNNKESVTVYVHDVPIEFLNEDTSLADKGLVEKFDRHVMDVHGHGFLVVHVEPDRCRDEDGQCNVEDLAALTFHRPCPPFRH